MGLDCFWKNKEGQTANIGKSFNVCGGIFSDNGTTSFRGKVYNDLIKQASEISLYQEEIDSDTCKKISDALDNFDFSEYDGGGWPVSLEEFKQLKEMFREHTNNGHHLVGWW